MSNGSSNGIAPNAKRLLWAGFAAILAAGIGFGIRGGILANWGADFGFTAAQLGDINGAGFTGFCFGIIIGACSATKSAMGSWSSPHSRSTYCLLLSLSALRKE